MSAEIHRMDDYRAPHALPSALTSVPNWLVWRLVQKPGEKKPRKVPFYVDGGTRSGAQGTPEDRKRLATYDRAAAACAKGAYTGVGFGVLPGDNLVALDFDNCVSGGVIEPRIAALVSGTYAEFSPSGNGIRAFMKGDLRSRKNNADAADRNADGSRKDGLFDIEFFGHNGFVTITGNVTPDCDLFGLEDTVQELTPEVKALYKARFGDEGALVVRNSPEVEDPDDISTLTSLLGWSLDDARQYLFDCDPNVSRQQWLNALMAVHYELGGSVEGLDLCDEWSSQGDSYGGRPDVEGRWRSFGKGGGSGLITGRWLLRWRKECLSHLKYDAVAERKKEIAAAPDEFTLREKICPEIRKDARLDDLGREGLAQALLDAFKRVGSKYPIGQCRSLLIEPKAERRERDETPQWLKDWVYVSDKDRFYRMDSDEWLSIQGFNAKFNRELPVGEDGSIGKTAAWVALEDYKIPTVTRPVYLPWAPSLFDMYGVQCVNSYRPSSVPKAVDNLSPQGKRAVAVVMRHLNLICGSRTSVVQTWVDWMAHNVQRPGVKVRWAPLIKGVEGDGKSVLGSLMAAVMGKPNVRNVSPKVLGTDFTGWGEGSALVVLEEIKLTGHNRHDILNAVKPFITNDTVEIHRKGQDGYDGVNTSNYLAFTNFSDALPLTDTDRRWWIVFSPFYNLSDLAAVIKAGPPSEVLAEYFDELNATVQQHWAELRRWLLDHPISESFKPNSAAPMTEEKSVMVGMSVSDDEMTVREMLEKGGPGITPEVFLSSYLSNEVITTGVDVDLKTSAWNRMLSRIGYTRLPKKFKWRGKTEIVWVKGHKLWVPSDVRKWLAQTLPEGVSEDSEVLNNDDLF